MIAGVSALVEVAAAASVVGAGVSAYSSIQQGQATAKADKQKALAESINATQQQINMRQKMLAAMASQNAGSLGAVGTGGPTSFGANTLRQINQGTNDLMVNSANASSQVSLLDNAASNATSAGTLGAVSAGVGAAGNANVDAVAGKLL
jgi:hypothetical protein